MSSASVQVRNLSKRFRLGVIGRQTLRDEIAYMWHRMRGRDPEKYMGEVSAEGPLAGSGDIDAEGKNLWALKDVSFEVKPGEVLGIIGRNGAGKSSLLKVLARITEPTSGEADIEGRIASLLEVSVKTIGTHRGRIMKKLGVHSVAELTKFAIREGLATPEP